MFGLGMTEMLIVGLVAVLLFGSRLPSVARSLGRSMTEFKKGMQGIEDEMHEAVHSQPKIDHTHDENEQDDPSGPRFEPPTSEPQAETADSAESEKV